MDVLTHFLVAGGTGRQGGAVVTALLSDSSKPIPAKNIHVLTRNTSGAAAKAVAERGVKLVQGDLNAPTAIFSTLTESEVSPAQLGVFLAQTHGPTELTDGKGFIDAAQAAGVRYFVYSSVDRGGTVLSDKDASYCKTFADKFHIEKHLIATTSKASPKTMDYTILRPTWFAENADWGFPGRLCMTAWRDNMNGKRLQVVVAKDLGRWAVEAFLRPDQAGIRNGALSVTSDELTFKEVDQISREETGVPVGTTFAWPTKLMVWAITDLRTMFAFIEERDYGAELDKLKRTVEPTTFREWVRTNVHKP